MEENEKKVHIKKCGSCSKQVSWSHGSKPDTCPYCQAIRWDKPHDECILFNIQKKYIETKDKQYLDLMYVKMIPYASKTIRKLLGSTKLDDDRLEDKIEDSVTTVISYFLRKPDFYITESFGFQLLKAAQQQLYRKKQKDIDTKEISYDSPIDDTDKTYKDKISEDTIEDGNKYSHDLVNISNQIFLVKELSQFVDQVYNAIALNRGIDEAIMALVLLHHYLTKQKEEFFNEFYTYYGYHLRESFETEKVVLLAYLKELNSTNFRM